MTRVQFGDRDAQILYFVPQHWADVFWILNILTFLDRTYPPSFAQFSTCIEKGIRVGIVEGENRKFRITPAWYERIHGNDKTSGEPLYEFEQWLFATTWESQNDCSLRIDEDEYAAAAERANTIGG